jgi:hypothetical protein
LDRFRSFNKTVAEKRADSIEALAQQICVSASYMAADDRPPEALLHKLPDDVVVRVHPVKEFQEPDPFQTIFFPSVYPAKVAISEYFALLLGKLEVGEFAVIEQILAETMEKNR